MLIAKRRIVIAAVIAVCMRLLSAHGADEAILVKGERVSGDAGGGQGLWTIGATTYKVGEVLCIRFSPDPPPDHVPAGVFIRGGTLLTGTLTSRKGESAEIASNVFGAIKIKKEEVVAAFFPSPPDQNESMPELSRYASLQSAALGSPGAVFKPGQQSRIRATNGDELVVEKLGRIDSENVMYEMKDRTTDSFKRSSVRLIEAATGALPPPSAEDERYGPEMIVRLRSGDLLRGRVMKLNDKALVLHTTYMGDKTLERSTLAAIFPSGGAGLLWLSAETPVKAVYTPLFDSEFPARMDLSVDGGSLVMGAGAGSMLCDRGIGVHSRSQLSYTLSGAPATFVAVVGIDAETKGRGEVSARVLADGKEVWSAASISAKDPPKIIAVNLGTPRTLDLEVDYGADGDDSGDHFDWGWAAVTK